MTGKIIFSIISIILAMGDVWCERCTNPEIYGRCNCIDETNGKEVRVECSRVQVREVQNMFERAKKHEKVILEFIYTNNRVFELPEEFFNGVEIHKVVFILSKLNKLNPEVFKGVENFIKIFHIEKSSIHGVPIKAMNSIDSLEDFAFSGKDMQRVGSNFLDGVERKDRFKKLGFPKTGMDSMRKGALSSFPNLLSVSLNGNHLSSISSRVFPPGGLKNLNLDNNTYEEFPGTLLKAIKDDGWLSLKGNDIFSINRFEEAKGNTKININLKDNPIQCNCDWATMDLIENKRVLGTCRAPSSFEGKELRNLKKQEFAKC